MAARVVESLFLCSKRWDLEEKLLDLGHKWPRKSLRNRAPLCAAELVIRILCWLDLRGDPHGRMYGVAPAEIERAAHWTGTPGALVSALIATRWIDEDPAGMRWHGYGSLNRITLSDRAKKRDKRGDSGSQKRGTDEGTKEGTARGTDRGRPCPSPGDPQKDLPGQERARDLAPLGGAVAAREAEPVHVASSTLPNGLPSGVPVAPLFVPLPKRLPTPSRRP